MTNVLHYGQTRVLAQKRTKRYKVIAKIGQPTLTTEIKVLQNL